MWLAGPIKPGILPRNCACFKLEFLRLRPRRWSLLHQSFREEHALLPGVARLVPLAHEIALLGLAYDGHERAPACFVTYLRADFHDCNPKSAISLVATTCRSPVTAHQANR